MSYTGNEKVWPFIEQAKPAPRGHSVPVPGELGGAAMVIDLLVKRADELGVQFRYETGVTNLIVDDGAVVGVRWKHFTEAGAVKAKSVIIAAGGFAMNPEMVAEHTPALGQKRRTKHHGMVEPYILGNPNDDGLGIRMGVSAGGVAKNLDRLFITAAAYPPEILLTGIIVNNQGDRFVAEDSYHSRTSAFVLEQPDQTAYLIVDEAHMQMPEMPLIRFIDGWETVEEMEAALGIPEGKLVARLTGTTRTRHVARIPTSTSSRNTLRPKTKGPWAAFDLSLGRAMYSGFTMGGLAVTIDGEVLREDGSVIPGLYAAGACASNIAQDGKGYASGTQLGEGSFFGRRAGTRAARSLDRARAAKLPSPSNSSRRSWCCSSEGRWLTLTTMQFGSWVRSARYSANSCPSSSAEVDSSRKTTLGLASRTRANATRCCSPGDRILRPVGDIVEPAGQVAERNCVECRPDRVVGMRARLRWIGHRRAQVYPSGT